ncbi:MAG TPA: hypothetical protein VM364_15810 [Vicinamibacterales bacterium]|nr:hypothetical protein [Vicinamibacterales bacterium]
MSRVILGALTGAAAAAAALLLLTFSSPRILLDMDRDLPRPLTSGFYPVEWNGDETFAWTAPRANVTLRDVDRRVEWRCGVRLRGARPPEVPRAHLALAVDGRAVQSLEVGNEYETVELTAPTRRAPGLTLSIAVSPPFVPGGSDRRELGVQVDRVECVPAHGSLVRPPAAAIGRVAIAGAAFGILLSLLFGAAAGTAAGAALALALAWVVTTGVGAYTRAYLDWIPPLALCIAIPSAAWAAWRGARVASAARFVVAFSAAVLFLKLVALFHPSKDLIDAVFHAHRLEWVMAGRYFFTQPMPGGVQFPYAIGLYATAAPFAAFVRDHVALLRIVVCTAEAVAVALLYLVVVRARSDRLAGAAAVVLYHLAPLPYVVIGNANLTYAFGQSLSVVAFALATLLTFAGRNLMAAAALWAVASLAFLSHVGVFPLLAVALLLLGLMYWTARGDLRVSGTVLLVVTATAAVFSVAVYYAHFPEVYDTIGRVTSPQSAASASQAPAAAPLPVSARATRAVSLGLTALGGPLILLAFAGAVLAGRGARDRLALALAAWGGSFVVFVLFRVGAPVDATLQRYADEFIERVYYATLPAVAVLAGLAVSWGWRSRPALRLAAAGLILSAAAVGVSRWISWIR